MREATINRKTAETAIALSLNLDDVAVSSIDTGCGFFDHMLNSLAIHAELGIGLEMSGDLHVDCHHTIEDVGIVLGKLLGEIVSKRGKIMRYGC